MSDKNNNGKNSAPQTGSAGDAPRLTVKVPLGFLPSPPRGFVFPSPIRVTSKN